MKGPCAVQLKSELDQLGLCDTKCQIFVVSVGT